MRRKLLLLVTGLLFLHVLWAQNNRDIRFKDESGHRIQHYHIVTVKDDRADTSSIGMLKMGLFGKKDVTINLEQGAATAVNSFIQKSFQQDINSTPVDLHITELSVKELPGGIRTKLETIITVAFFVNGTRITDYRGKGEIQTMGDLFKHIEDLLRQNLRNSLLEFDGWWSKNKLVYSSDAPIKLTVDIVDVPKDTNLLGYSAARLLSPGDFRATPDDLSRAAASTSSAITVRYTTTTDNGQISVHVLITPYFDKLKSWFLAKYKDNAKVLLHEQRHFDISAIKAYEMADSMRQQKLTKSNVLDVLELISAQKTREMNDLQAQYDAETRHGMNSTAQEKWNKQIVDMLAKLECYQ